MATLTREFQKSSAAIHAENSQVLEELRLLEHALDRITLATEPFDRLATAKEAEIYAKWLAAELPEHFVREEHNLLDSVADISPQLAEFGDAMKMEHRQFSASLDELNGVIRNLEYSLDLEPALEEMCARGKAFVQAMRAHILLEEEELSGFL